MLNFLKDHAWAIYLGFWLPTYGHTLVSPSFWYLVIPLALLVAVKELR